MDGCPWDDFASGGTVAFCEARLCAWVVEPSNAWSNLAFLFVSACLLWLCRDRLSTRLGLIPLVAFAMGVGSFAFHATGTRVGEVIDDCAMYGVSCMFISFAVARWRDWSPARTMALFAVLLVVSVVVRVNMTVLGIPFFAAQLVAFGVLEIAMVRWRPAPTQGWLWAVAAAFALSFAAWVLDATGLACHPDNHLVTGHAVWHVGTALCLYLYYRFQEALVPIPDPPFAPPGT